MMQSVYSRNSTSLQRLRKSLRRFLFKIRHRSTYLADYEQTQRYLRFKREVRAALFTQIRNLSPEVVRKAVEYLTKLSDFDAAKVRAIIDQQWGSFDNFLSESGIENYLIGTYNDSANNTLDSLDVSAVFDLQNPVVIQKLSDRANFLIKSVDETTKENLSNIISQGVEASQSWQEIAQTIQDQNPQIADYRSELIARMETANATNLATLDFYQQNGIEQKEWVLDSGHDPNNCDGSCDDNADDGLIDVNDSFSSGDDAPPSHINCRCVLNTVLPSDFIENGPSWTGE